MKEGFTILLYYKYVEVKDPQGLLASERELCQRLDLKGRIIIAEEGINGTLEGRDSSIEEYLKSFLADPRFADVHIKKSVGTGDAFPRLKIKVRDEIVSLDLPHEDDVDPRVTTGTHLDAAELNRWFKEGKEFAIVDMRNDYEHKVGHFEGSVLPKMRNFRDLPNVLQELEPLKEKTVLTVCTGGVRCEKASGYLIKKGFSDVYQLDGGIVTYMEKYKNDDFKGKLYVFDGRKVMTFTPDDRRTVVGRCDRCAAPTETFENCANDACHKQMLICAKCFGENSRCGGCEGRVQ